METMMQGPILTQLGMAGVFAAFAWKLYKDQRTDAKRREEDAKKREDELRKDARVREDKLMSFLQDQAVTNQRVADTLDRQADTLGNINLRLCELEDN